MKSSIELKNEIINTIKQLQIKVDEINNTFLNNKTNAKVHQS